MIEFMFNYIENKIIAIEPFELFPEIFPYNLWTDILLILVGEYFNSIKVTQMSFDILVTMTHLCLPLVLKMTVIE